MSRLRTRSTLLAVAAVTCVAASADDLASDLIRFYLIDRALTALVELTAAGVGYVAEKVPDGVEALKDKAREGYLKIKLPELKRHTNFIMVRNASTGDYRLALADRDKNEKGREESGTLAVYRSTGDKNFPLEEMAVLKPGGKAVFLMKGTDYILYPKFEGKILGYKGMAKPFVRTLELDDLNGGVVAFNLVRETSSGAKVSFGYTFNSWPRDPAKAPVLLDPQYDDIVVIPHARIQNPPAKPY